MTTTTVRRASPLVALLAAAPVLAADLSLPGGARLTLSDTEALGSYELPLGGWVEETGIQTIRVEGPILREAWRIDGAAATTLQLLAPLRDQLTTQGFTLLYECQALGCGGFDFRFATPVLPGPAMYVDLTDYRFLSARDVAGAHVSLLVSRSNAAGFVQIIRIGALGAAATRADAARPRAAPVGPVPETLEAQGHVVLSDLVFGSGAASLGTAEVPSLEAIAAYLKANPERQILFVGHTDATGALQANVELSRRRAEAAVGYLRERHGISGDQIGADGVGYLSPVASNLSDAGRKANRRVEAVLVSTE